jgi:hypothetical protein
MPIWPKQSECDQFYGNPRGRNGLANATWEAANLEFVAVPWKMVAAWGSGTKITRMKVHKKCAASLYRVLQAIWISALKASKDKAGAQALIESWGLHLYGGGYNFRPKRGRSVLSMHAYGCAIDLDPDRNDMGDRAPHLANCPEVVKAFTDEGWAWGGDWENPDAMHFQAARV